MWCTPAALFARYIVCPILKILNLMLQFLNSRIWIGRHQAELLTLRSSLYCQTEKWYEDIFLGKIRFRFVTLKFDSIWNFQRVKKQNSLGARKSIKPERAKKRSFRSSQIYYAEISEINWVYRILCIVCILHILLQWNPAKVHPLLT